MGQADFETVPGITGTSYDRDHPVSEGQEMPSDRANMPDTATGTGGELKV